MSLSNCSITITVLSTLATSSSRYLCSNSSLLESRQYSLVCCHWFHSSLVVAASRVPLAFMIDSSAWMRSGLRSHCFVRQHRGGVCRGRGRPALCICGQRLTGLRQIRYGLHHVIGQYRVQLLCLFDQRLDAIIELPGPLFEGPQFGLRFIE